MEKKYYKYIIIIFLLVGIASLIYSTYLFSYKISQVDDEINNLQRDLLVITTISTKLDSADGTRITIWLMKKILLEIDDNSSSISSFNDSMTNAVRNVVAHLYEVNEGGISQETFDKLNNMDYNQLNELRNSFPLYPDYPEEIIKQLSAKQIEKANVLRNAIIFQILGLIINQIAVVLTIIWKIK